MKVAIVGPVDPDTLEFNMKDTLERMGHEVVAVYDRDVSRLHRSERLRRFLEGWQRVSHAHSSRLFTRIAQRVLASNPDFVIVTPRTVHPDLSKTLKAARPELPVVHVNPDAVINLGRGYVFISAYDALFTKDRFIERFMRDKLKLNGIYLPESYNPHYHKRPDIAKAAAEEQTGIDVLVIGSVYPYRSVFLDQLVSAGVNLTICGSLRGYVPPGNWDGRFAGEYIVGARKAELFYGSKIVLNMMHYSEIEGVNCKFFEILGCEGFQICDWKPVVPELATPDREVVTFETIDEAIEKIRHYLAHDEERWTIARAGYERARREHTYERRFERMFAEFPQLESGTPAYEEDSSRSPSSTPQSLQ